MKEPGVVAVEALVVRHHHLEELLPHGEVGDGRQQPAVAKLALLYVEAGGAFHEEAAGKKYIRDIPVSQSHGQAKMS